MFAIGLESSKNAIFCYTLRNRCFDRENFQCNRLNKCIRNSAQKKDTVFDRNFLLRGESSPKSFN